MANTNFPFLSTLGKLEIQTLGEFIGVYWLFCSRMHFWGARGKISPPLKLLCSYTVRFPHTVMLLHGKISQPLTWLHGKISPPVTWLHGKISPPLMQLCGKILQQITQLHGYMVRFPHHLRGYVVMRLCSKISAPYAVTRLHSYAVKF